MNSLDFFFYSFVTFQVKVLKREVDDSRWSAALMTGLFLFYSITAIFLSISIFCRNNLADICVNTNWALMILGLISVILMVWRFFYFVRYESLIVKRQKIKHVWIYHVINWLIVIGGPILDFVTFRLYLYGYV